MLQSFLQDAAACVLEADTMSGTLRSILVMLYVWPRLNTIIKQELKSSAPLMLHHTMFYIGSVICCHLEQDQAVCEVSVTEKQQRIQLQVNSSLNQQRSAANRNQYECRCNYPLVVQTQHWVQTAQDRNQAVIQNETTVMSPEHEQGTRLGSERFQDRLHKQFKRSDKTW